MQTPHALIVSIPGRNKGDRCCREYARIKFRRFKFFKANALHRAQRPTGMKTGVSITPRRVVSVPGGLRLQWR